jgi:hypothetical protein
METKVLVTGLWMGGSENKEECQLCNYDYSWIFDNTSTLIWADKIILTPFLEATIQKEAFPDHGGPIAKVINKTIEEARSYGIIETRDPETIITPELLEKTSVEADFDISLLRTLFPKQVKITGNKRVPGEFYIEDESYCQPFIQSVYSSLILAKAWNAECLFSDRVFKYCRYKFGTSVMVDRNLGQPPNAFDTILNSYLPKYQIFPNYVFPDLRKKKCPICVNKSKCSKKYLSKFESNLARYLELRDYDEVTQIKELIRDIISRLEFSGGKVNHESIIHEFKNEERKMMKRIRKTFPKIGRWSNITLLASVPATAIGIATGLPLVTAIGASMAGLSQATKEYIKYINSKYKWIGFTGKDVKFQPTSGKSK